MCNLKTLWVVAAMSAAVVGCKSATSAPGGDSAAYSADDFVPATTFATPEDAVAAVVAQATSGTPQTAADLYGPRYIELLNATEVLDQQDRERFLAAMQKHWELSADPDDPDTLTLLVGDRNWAFPIPLVRSDGQWWWDTDAGIEEVVSRRIGHNELGTINTCRAYVLAQQEYARQDHDGDGVLEYSRNIRSSAGRQDGLYWVVDEGEEKSPMGALLADATTAVEGEPYFGYRFRILDAQGDSAAGGAMSYYDGPNMVRGFAMIAVPADYGVTGVMTFLVGPDGGVYETDLGQDTGRTAAKITAYDPDDSWTVTED